MGEEVKTGENNTPGQSTREGKTITLPSGKTALIYRGKGRDSNRALKESDGDSSKYLICLMAALVEVDGRPVVPEDLEDLDLKDYTTLQTEFATENF